MKKPPVLAGAAGRGLAPFRGRRAAHLLPQARLGGPMPWVIAIMVALTVLAAGGGLALANLADRARGELAGSATVQIVDPEVTPAEFASEFDVPRRTMECCVKLGYLAVDTRSNAGEAAQWLKEHDYTSVRLVTTDWHMARAASEFAGTLPPQIDVLKDAVPSHPNLPTLFLEYNKLLAAAISQGLPD